jgi:hypothetical protein
MDNTYPLKQWLVTLTISPFLLAVYEYFWGSSATAKGYIELYTLFLLLGIAYSLPVFVIYYLSFFLLSKRVKSPLSMKIILNIIAITGVYITFKILGGALTPGLSITYIVTIFVSSLILKISVKKETNTI